MYKKRKKKKDPMCPVENLLNSSSPNMSPVPPAPPSGTTTGVLTPTTPGAIAESSFATSTWTAMSGAAPPAAMVASSCICWVVVRRIESRFITLMYIPRDILIKK